MFLLVLIPVIAYGLAGMLIDYLIIRFPHLTQNPSQIIRGVDNLYFQIGVTLILTILLYLVLSLIGSAIYSLSGARERDELVSRLGSGRRRFW